MADLQTRQIRGNFVFWDTHRKRLVDAFGPDVIKYELQPGHLGGIAGASPAGWTETVVEVGAGTSEFIGSTLAGYVGDIITAANENDGWSGQLSGSSFELTADQDLYFGIQAKINDVTQVDFFGGLAVTDTAILGGVTDRIGFQTLDGSTDLTFAIEKDGTETLSPSLVTLVADTLVFAEFYWDGSSIEVFLNGISVLTPALTNLPNDVALRLSLELLTGEASAQTGNIRQLRVIQIGR